MNVFQVIQVNYSHPRRYPRFGAYSKSLMVASSLEEAERFLGTHILEERAVEDAYAFYVREIPVDVPAIGAECLSERVYGPDGVLIDRRDFSSVGAMPGVFGGREPGEVRFAPGDIVEVLWDGYVQLAFVAFVPPGREEAAEENAGECPLDAFDDSYLVFLGPKYCWHEQVDALRVFAPRFRIPEATLTKIVKARRTWLRRLGIEYPGD